MDLPAIVWSQRHGQRRHQGNVYRLIVYMFFMCICFYICMHLCMNVCVLVYMCFAFKIVFLVLFSFYFFSFQNTECMLLIMCKGEVSLNDLLLL